MYKVLVSTLAIFGLVGCAEMKKMMHEKEVEGNLVACPANKTSIGDVPSCGKVWKLAWGEAELKDNGDIEAEVKGLVLNDTSTGAANGTPDGVDGVAAAVVCNTPSGAAVAAQTDVVALSKEGNAKIKAHVNLPSCIAPMIVLRERYEGKIGGWLAATGI
jgi:hypothetical protein